VAGAPGRVARRRAAVRRRILEAADALVTARGVDAVTIDNVTAAADIARRSFYHHFRTKHEILIPIARARTETLTRRIDRLVARIADPAEGMATALRHAFRAIPADPLCRWFIRRSGLPPEQLYEGMAESGMRDAERAVEAGRFHVARPEVVRTLVSGAFVAVVSARTDGRMDNDDVDEAVEYLLRLFGLTRADAHDLAHRPLRRLPPDRRGA
jgi:AcrR family transcriptional regulator